MLLFARIRRLRYALVQLLKIILQLLDLVLAGAGAELLQMLLLASEIRVRERNRDRNKVQTVRKRWGERAHQLRQVTIHFDCNFVVASFFCY